MRAPRQIGKSIGKFDPVKFEKNVEGITKGLVRNLNANVIKDAAKRKTRNQIPPEDINKNGENNDKHPPE